MREDFKRLTHQIGKDEIPFYLSNRGSDTVACVSGPGQNPLYSFEAYADELRDYSFALFGLPGNRFPPIGDGEDILMPGGWVYKERCEAVLSGINGLENYNLSPRVLIGHSEGGLIVSEIAPKLPIKLMILLSPSPNLRETFYRFAEHIPPLVYKKIFEGSGFGFMNLPDFDSITRYISDGHVSEENQKGTKASVVCFYGGDDVSLGIRRCELPDHLKRFHGVYKEAGVDIETVVLSGRGHFLDERLHWMIDLFHEFTGRYPINAPEKVLSRIRNVHD